MNGLRVGEYRKERREGERSGTENPDVGEYCGERGNITTRRLFLPR